MLANKVIAVIYEMNYDNIYNLIFVENEHNNWEEYGIITESFLNICKWAKSKEKNNQCDIYYISETNLKLH